ncbi:uncharacterized protein LOC119067455 [Bradysia coprophila]|uniref:uncharacterized protein LOC119067455 n=1 Tax=Bradysia coprophila TaxID=38358 RepID=UPI00187DB3AB|nr:uncharacterized protein LOC119067455 [Bradysia coprophila]
MKTKIQLYKIGLMFIVGMTTVVHSSNSTDIFVERLKEMNTHLLSAHITSLNYLTDQQSTISRIISTHTLDVIAETSNAIVYMDALEKQSHIRLNRKTDLKRPCWLYNFYQINHMTADNLSVLSKCGIDNINSTIALSTRYFHSMVNTMLYESALGTTNALHAIGMYNPMSEQWKISRTLESVVKFSVDGWNGTMSIVDDEVKQYRDGVERNFQKLEECETNVVQKFSNAKIEVTTSKCV